MYNWSLYEGDFFVFYLNGSQVEVDLDGFMISQ